MNFIRKTLEINVFYLLKFSTFSFSSVRFVEVPPHPAERLVANYEKNYATTAVGIVTRKLDKPASALLLTHCTFCNPVIDSVRPVLLTMMVEWMLEERIW